MHFRYHLIYFILFVLIAISCQLTGTSETKQYNVELIANDIIEIDPLASRHMGRILFHNFSFNEEGSKLLLHDFDSGSLTIVNREGKYINHFGRKGSGPDEFQQIQYAEFDRNGSVIALDGATGMFKRFSTDGDLLETTESIIEKGIWARGLYMYQYNDHWFFTMQAVSLSDDDTDNAETKTVAKFNSNFELIALFGKYDSFMFDKETISKNPSMTIDKQTGLIYVIQSSSPNIMIYDADSHEFVEEIRGTFSPNYKPYFTDILHHHSIEERSKILLNQSISSDIYTTDNYVLFFFINQTQEFYDTRDTSTREHYFKVYSKANHEYLGEVELPNVPVSVHHVDDTVLLLKDDDPDNMKFQAYNIVNSNTMMVQDQ